MHVSLYYTKIKTLWDQYDSLVAIEACICRAGKSLLERVERDREIEFLQGLHDRFSNLRSQILTMDPFPNALRIFNLVQQEEEQQNITASPLPTVESTSLNINGHAPQHPRSSTSHNKRQHAHCDYCNRHGHVCDKCYRLHGFPSTPGNPPTTANTTIVTQENQVAQPQVPSLSAEQYSRLIVLLVGTIGCSDTNFPNNWYQSYRLGRRFEEKVLDFLVGRNFEDEGFGFIKYVRI
ncbi:uncharacterized protein LOC113329698 [Papaver somniferum]|uniref:uncharacterized protein LOC113329698 n=1 Tax=Papaver somniferum TaxID=3469 RepID=UPI000E6F4D7E|nr:uncharacterized protein LOC113329698 [Papaver somniferum]